MISWTFSDCFSKTSDRWAGLGGHNSLCPHQRDGAYKHHGLAWTIPIFANGGFLARLTRRHLQGANPHLSTISNLAVVYLFKWFSWNFVAAPTRVLKDYQLLRSCMFSAEIGFLLSMIAMPFVFWGVFLFCPLPVAMSISLLIPCGRSFSQSKQLWESWLLTGVLLLMEQRSTYSLWTTSILYATHLPTTTAMEKSRLSTTRFRAGRKLGRLWMQPQEKQQEQDFHLSQGSIMPSLLLVMWGLTLEPAILCGTIFMSQRAWALVLITGMSSPSCKPYLMQTGTLLMQFHCKQVSLISSIGTISPTYCTIPSTK